MGAVLNVRRPPLRVLGVRVDPVRTADVLAAVEDMLADSVAHYIVTVNPEFIVRARRDSQFRHILDSSDLATADGVGVVFALRALYGVRTERIAGADLIVDLARLAAQRNWPVFLLGAGPGVAELAANSLLRQVPDLQVAGTRAGSPATSEDEWALSLIRGSNARLLFVAYGAPQQEYWISRNLPNLGSCVAVGVGGAFDYLAGVVPRAPLWMRTTGLEWLYRLVRQPSRWRRQLALPVFIVWVTGAWIRRSLRSNVKQ